MLLVLHAEASVFSPYLLFLSANRLRRRTTEKENKSGEEQEETEQKRNHKSSKETIVVHFVFHYFQQHHIQTQKADGNGDTLSLALRQKKRRRASSVRTQPKMVGTAHLQQIPQACRLNLDPLWKAARLIQPVAEVVDTLTTKKLLFLQQGI
jgi:hypothetical protein